MGLNIDGFPLYYRVGFAETCTHALGEEDCRTAAQKFTGTLEYLRIVEV
ncbi:protein of unknown function [Kyrpidia spormannii]|uniref:Uncharacterized protein n=1 Tax=Kyrpidia spormannii TaxID=2055160 RepID=A0A6F9E8C8_9BACL|nr:protein of unknown function [Kyrpidia spormannii]